MTEVTIPVTGVVDTDIEYWLAAYWTGLKDSLDDINVALYNDLVANATSTLSLFDTSFLTSSQIVQAKALLICIDAAEFSSVAGNSQEKYYSKLKIYDRTMEKAIGLDSFTGSFCRLLKITLNEYNSKTSTVRNVIYTKTRSNSIYLAPNMDNRGRVYRDYDLVDIVTDRKSYPLDNRYI